MMKYLFYITQFEFKFYRVQIKLEIMQGKKKWIELQDWDHVKIGTMNEWQFSEQGLASVIQDIGIQWLAVEGFFMPPLNHL